MVQSSSTTSTSTASTTTLGGLLAERLWRAGVRRAYGFPGGGSNLDLVEAFEDAGIRWILSHTEGGAAFMACADAEITRVPGVLVVGNGPGLASAVNGVAQAWLDRVPLIVISDRYTEAEAATTGHQVIDQRALLAPVVKHGATLEPADARVVVDRALEDCLASPKGPVHLDMPRDSARHEVSARAPGGLEVARPTMVPFDAVEEFAGALAQGKRPLILLGLQANDGVEPRELVGIAHASGAATLTTYKAKGVYPEADRRWGGILTGGEIERPLLERADVILSIGLDAVELLGRPWPYEAPAFSIAADAHADDYLRPVRRHVGDVAASVSALARCLSTGPTAAGFSEGEVARLRDAALESLRLDGREPLPGWRIVETVMSRLPDASTIAVDSGAHMLPATNFVRPSGPRRFLISNGLATMGFAVPAAVGAALSRPGDIAVAFTGDGGMAYHASEIETATRTGARVIVVVFNDSSLSLIRIKQEARGYTRSPLNFGLTQFDRLAEGLGVRGVRVQTAKDLETAVEEAVSEVSSTVIDVRTTGREYARTLTAIRG